MKVALRLCQRKLLLITWLLILSGLKAFAQAPVISYPTPQVFPLYKTITPLPPQTGGGGPIPANAYGMVTTFAGGRAPVTFDATGTGAGFNLPSGIAFGSNGTIYVSDFGSGAIRKITPAAVVTTINNVSNPAGLTLDPQGNFFITDFQDNYVYKITPGGVKSIYAGNGATGAVNGAAAASSFNSPGGITADGSGNIYVADQQNNMIREITSSGTVKTFAGTGSPGANNGASATASFNNPDGLTFDSQGNMYVTDTKNNLIRKITPAGIVSTFAGSRTPGNADGQGIQASFNYPTGITSDALGNLYAADYNNNLVRKITPGGAVTTLAGNGTPGQNNAIGKLASFYGPIGLAVDPSGYLYVTDEINYVVRKITLTGYTIDKPLPAGLTFDPNTGTISGTPVASSPATDYTITAYNTSGSSSTIVNIAVTGIAPVVTTSTVTGNVSGCVGSPSQGSNTGQFTVAGTSLSGDITVTAPEGFYISLTTTGGYSTSLTLKQSSGFVTNTTIYISTSATDPVGSYSGNIQVATPGSTAIPIAIAGIVNALPTVDQPQSQTVNAGALTNPVNFTGTGGMFTWTNDTPGIGLPASGSGDIAAFTAVNNGASPITATVNVTPFPLSYAYIANGSSNNVSVISLATNSVVKTIPAGDSPLGVSVSPDGSRAYVANQGSNSITVINTTTNTVAATITEGQGAEPSGIAVSPDGTLLYVANYNSYSAFSGVAVYNTATNGLVANISFGGFPYSIAVSHNGSRVYAAGANGVTVIKTATNAIITTIPVGIAASCVVVSPDDSKVYVTDPDDDFVYIIDTSTNMVAGTIPVGLGPSGIALSPDGSRIYVSNSNENTISVISTATNKVINTIPTGDLPVGISVSADGSTVYVVNSVSGAVTVISSSTNAKISTVPVGLGPESFGNFIAGGSGCAGTPVPFKITVYNSQPIITASTATGVISACTGLPSASPNIQQFTVSGGNLTGDITATAPPNFEVSLSPDNGYSNNITIPQSAGAVTNVTVYVRSSASAAGSIAGTGISGNITLSSPGATNQPVAVTGTVYAAPTVNPVGPFSVTAGQPAQAVVFTGTAGFYTWTNDTPGIGLATSGTGNIPSFTALNNTPDPLVATITVMPRSMSAVACAGMPIQFTITVNPAPPPVITTSGTLTGLSTIYGTTSSSESFTISVTNAPAAILVTPPAGFEVSTDGKTFSGTVMVGQAGDINAATVYVRLAATTTVGNYFGNIVLSTAGVTGVNVNMPLSIVARAPLTVKAPDVSRVFGVPNPVFIPQYLGFVNGDNQSVLTTLPDLTTIATINSQPGQYAIHVSGGSALNYTLFPVDGTLTITPSPSEINIPNAFTPNGDGINDLWNIKQLVDFPQCLVSVYSRYGSLVFQSHGYAKPWDGTSNGSPVPTGTYYYIINTNLGGFPPLSGYVAVLR